MTKNPFRDRLAGLPKPARRIDEPKIIVHGADRVGFTAPRPAVDPFARGGFPVKAVAMISERQQSYALDLLASKDLSAEQRPKFAARLRTIAASWDTELPKLTAEQASALIDALLSLPTRRAAVAQAPMFRDETGVPAGRYAYTGTEGHTVFVQVDRPIGGKWAGYTFVKLQLSDELQRMSRDAQTAALRAIREQGVRESLARYGHELGRCGVCGRTLTNEASRIEGIGPKCAAGL